MSDSEIQGGKKSSCAADHMANERTFLAWIRTSIGIMAFGFVVERFTLFMKQVAVLLDKTDMLGLPHIPSFFPGYSSIFGLFLVAFGALISLLAFIQYKNVEKQIENDTYRAPVWLNVMLTLTVLLTGIFLVTYLSNAI